MAAITEPAAFRSILQDEERQYRRIYLSCFPLFLVIAITARLLPPAWRPFPRGPERRRSIFAEAREAARSTIPYMFMH
jgi:hypothetical protein